MIRVMPVTGGGLCTRGVATLPRMVTALAFAIGVSACTGDDPPAPTPHPEAVQHPTPQVCAIGSTAAYQRYQGLTLPEVRRAAAARGLSLRVLGQDGECKLPPRGEVRQVDRLNVYVVSGKVFTASVG